MDYPMTREKKIIRYLMFLAGLMCNALGVALVTKGGLGTSPIAAIPYSLSIIIPKLSMGNWMILYNWLLIAIEWILLKKNARKADLITQAVITVVFGYLTDLFLLVFKGLVPGNYVARLLLLVCGCTVIAFGAFLEVTADISMLPADGFVNAIAKVTSKEYGQIRVVSDVAMSVIACALCLIFLRRFAGVREGTVIAAIITGNIVRLISRLFRKANRSCDQG